MPGELKGNFLGELGSGAPVSSETMKDNVFV